MLPPSITARQLINRYDVILLDVWGVIADNRKVLPHVPEFVAELERLQKPYFILTNGASNSPESASQKLQQKGVKIAKEKIINSGTLVSNWLRENVKGKKRFIILGPEFASYITEDSGHTRVDLASDADGAIIANQEGYPFIEGVDRVLSLAMEKFQRKEEFHLILGNPDLIYARDEKSFGITCGAIALMIEAGLKLRLGQDAPSFIKIGKPYVDIFNEAKRRIPDNRSIVMVGDQIETDVRGALAAKIDAVLIGTGVCDIDSAKTYAELMPHFMLRDFSLS